MRITYSPRRIDGELSYSIDGEVVTATIDGQTDTFDFSSMPDGEAAEIVSVLDPCPVLAARRVDGVLHLTLLRAIPTRPQPGDYETPADYELALDTWKRLWTDDLEVVIGE